MLLVGGGEPTDELKKRAEEALAADRIILLSDRKDVAELLSAMDVFVMPSVVEGFPMSLIEAQATGLRCVVSDTVTKETALTEKICYLPLGCGIDEWAGNILCGKNYENPRGTLADYDIENVVKKLVYAYGT